MTVKEITHKLNFYKNLISFRVIRITITKIFLLMLISRLKFFKCQ